MFGGFIHHDKTDEVVTSFPQSRKFSEYLFDFCNYNAEVWKTEHYITSQEVSMLGHGKIMILWWVLDKYGGRYDSRGYSRNIVDVQIMLPSLNLHALEHFCYTANIFLSNGLCAYREFVHSTLYSLKIDLDGSCSKSKRKICTTRFVPCPLLKRLDLYSTLDRGPFWFSYILNEILQYIEIWNEFKV